MDQVAKKSRSVAFMAVLLSVFCGYNYCIYKESDDKAALELSPTALQGQALWQQHNCNSCHQLYGLGGYLGPDLTNAFSDKTKGPAYIKAMLNAGRRSMPVFDFSESEKEALVAYLKAVDQTGYFPDYHAKISPNGWVNISTK